MNEITKIHLGREVFTISIEAHKVLQAYLRAIERQVGEDENVVQEVEARMAELLGEHGITSDKVVLEEDVRYLKEQLGEPSDFKNDPEEAEANDKRNGSKRLFRDTEHGMIAGVAAGIGAFLGIDPLVVRLLFVLLVFAGGAGVLIYIVLWLLVPPAKTHSDHLQMQGRAVTVEAIKSAVDRADVSGAAGRATKVVGRFLERVAELTLAVVGTALAAAAIGLFLFAATAAAYLLMHGLDAAGQIIFPFGAKEVLWVICGFALLAVISVALAVVAVALIRRKWHVSAWALAGMLVIFMGSVSVGTALGFDAVPRFSERYDSLQHVEMRSVSAFKHLRMNGQFNQADFEQIDFNSPDYRVEILYMGAGDPGLVKTTVKDEVLIVDSSEFVKASKCMLICPYGPHNLRVIVHAPYGTNLQNSDGSPPVINKYNPWTHLRED